MEQTKKLLLESEEKFIGLPKGQDAKVGGMLITSMQDAEEKPFSAATTWDCSQIFRIIKNNKKYFIEATYTIEYEGIVGLHLSFL